MECDRDIDWKATELYDGIVGNIQWKATNVYDVERRRIGI
jgi:hypothetical protein